MDSSGPVLNSRAGAERYATIWNNLEFPFKVVNELPKTKFKIRINLKHVHFFVESVED